MNELTKRDLKNRPTANVVKESQSPIFKQTMKVRREIEEREKHLAQLREWGL